MASRRKVNRTCRRCGATFLGLPATGKHPGTLDCPVCRVLRDVQYCRNNGYHSRECVVCERAFAPLEMRDDHCPDCRGSGHYGPCEFCGEERELVHHDVGVCLWCAMDPNLRRKLEKHLQKLRASRGYTSPAPAVSDTDTQQPSTPAPAEDRTAAKRALCLVRGIGDKRPKAERYADITPEDAAACLADERCREQLGYPHAELLRKIANTTQSEEHNETANPQ